MSKLKKSCSLVKESPNLQLNWSDATLYLSKVLNPTQNQFHSTDSPKYFAFSLMIKCKVIFFAQIGAYSMFFPCKI
ncbi:unnamed protein product [Paramecium sonneborni]|uniref:Uncharacterized protein n=1 Tax=Paramecium sonneborni TaxID=65129 RepID=A0A8S1LD04_9CILI|nr:unnamed protein product [Paramecium sonneborni]